MIGGMVWAGSVDMATQERASLLEHSQLYIDKDGLSLQEIQSKNLFKPYHRAQLNAGVSEDSIWLKIELKNSSNSMLREALVLRSHRLEEITLYRSNGTPIGHRGVSYRKGLQQTLYPFFRIRIPPHTTETFYLKVNSIYSPILFSVVIEREKEYREHDKIDQMLKMFFLGMIVSLMIYSLVVSLYTRDKSYLFYSFYLFTVLFQQISYMGFSQVYFPVEWVEFEKKLVVSKVGLMLISTALFAIYFLKTWSIKTLHRGYQLIILLGILEILFVTIADQFSLSTMGWMGKLFVALNFLASIFNLVASTIYYRRGHREARLYILGFGILFVVHVLWTLGTLGFSSVIYDYPNMIIVGTTLEALVLSIAFADRYLILQNEKAKVDNQILEEAQNREQIVKNEVIEKTAQLKQALDTKELLLQEVHHRVKNNLQIILSMIRLQNSKLANPKAQEHLVSLESRINAIAKTYNMLLIGNDLEEVDMEAYIEVLLSDIESALNHLNREIDVITNIETTIPLRESVYVGLIINELFTNAYKYAFDTSGTITVSLSQKEGEVTLMVEDDGRGFVYDKQSNSLGLKLIHTLVRNQLKGTIEVASQPGTKYTIRFTL